MSHKNHSNLIAIKVKQSSQDDEKILLDDNRADEKRPVSANQADEKVSISKHRDKLEELLDSILFNDNAYDKDNDIVFLEYLHSLIVFPTPIQELILSYIPLRTLQKLERVRVPKEMKMPAVVIKDLVPQQIGENLAICYPEGVKQIIAKAITDYQELINILEKPFENSEAIDNKLRELLFELPTDQHFHFREYRGATNSEIAALAEKMRTQLQAEIARLDKCLAYFLADTPTLTNEDKSGSDVSSDKTVIKERALDRQITNHFFFDFIYSRLRALGQKFSEDQQAYQQNLDDLFPLPKQEQKNIKSQNTSELKSEQKQINKNNQENVKQEAQSKEFNHEVARILMLFCLFDPATAKRYLRNTSTSDLPQDKQVAWFLAMNIYYDSKALTNYYNENGNLLDNELITAAFEGDPFFAYNGYELLEKAIEEQKENGKLEAKKADETEEQKQVILQKRVATIFTYCPSLVDEGYLQNFDLRQIHFLYPSLFNIPLRNNRTLLQQGFCNKTLSAANFKFLLEEGQSLETPDRLGNTCWHYLAGYDDESLESSEFFLSLNSYQGNVDIPNRQGKTPLLLALEKQNLKIARWFIQHKADINFEVQPGKTEIILALQQEKFELACNLLLFGASIKEYNRNLIKFIITKPKDMGKPFSKEKWDSLWDQLWEEYQSTRYEQEFLQHSIEIALERNNFALIVKIALDSEKYHLDIPLLDRLFFIFTRRIAVLESIASDYQKFTLRHKVQQGITGFLTFTLADFIFLIDLFQNRKHPNLMGLHFFILVVMVIGLFAFPGNRDVVAEVMEGVSILPRLALAWDNMGESQISIFDFPRIYELDALIWDEEVSKDSLTEQIALNITRLRSIRNEIIKNRERAESLSSSNSERALLHGDNINLVPDEKSGVINDLIIEIPHSVNNEAAVNNMAVKSHVNTGSAYSVASLISNSSNLLHTPKQQTQQVIDEQVHKISTEPKAILTI